MHAEGSILRQYPMLLHLGSGEPITVKITSTKWGLGSVRAVGVSELERSHHKLQITEGETELAENGASVESVRQAVVAPISSGNFGSSADRFLSHRADHRHGCGGNHL